jgi:hypothetical protein
MSIPKTYPFILTHNFNPLQAKENAGERDGSSGIGKFWGVVWVVGLVAETVSA